MERELRVKQQYTHTIGALRLINRLNTEIPTHIVESSLVYQYENNMRRIVNLVTNAESYEQKTMRRDIDRPLYRYVVSSENPLTRERALQLVNPQSKTYRRRHIYNGWSTSYKGKTLTGDVHVTIRTTTSYESATPRTTQAISIEVELPREYEEEEMQAIVQALLELHNGFSIPNIPSIISSMRAILDRIGLRSSSQLQTPIDIKWGDITYANLIERPHTVSFKANGTRLLLCISNVGNFFITSSLDIVPISVIGAARIGRVAQPTTTISTMLIDGELIDDSYWVFDLLYEGTVSYMDMNTNERLARLRQLIRPNMTISSTPSLPLILGENTQPIVGNSISIILKPTVIPTSADSFFKAIEQMRAYPEEIDVEDDGLIISGINQPYSQSVYKWKPPSQLTVDFFIGPSSLESLTPTVGTQNMILYTFRDGGLYAHPELQFTLGGRTSQLVLGTVAEFHYTKSGDNVVWVYSRSRPDKAIPNRESVYLSILDLQRDPITQDVITGHSLKLMRKYHNRMKRDIYTFLRLQGVESITDVGSGKGGDLESWRRNRMNVIAIESNPTHYNELLERVRTMESIDTVEEMKDTDEDDRPIYIVGGSCWDMTLYPTTAQLYADNPAATTDAMTMFNVATFLGPSTITCMAQDIVKDSGYIVIMVIDGKVLSNVFLGGNDSYTSPLIEIRDIACPPDLQADSYGLGCINIVLHDSATVRGIDDKGQEEKLVNVELLLQTLQGSGWYADIDMFLTHEKLLGREEALYSSTQRLLIFKKRSTSTQIIRDIYRPLTPNVAQTLTDSPWGTVVRIGVPGGTSSSISITSDRDISFIHAILQASNAEYRALDNIGKDIYARSHIRSYIPPNIPIYLIPEDSWDMYMLPLKQGDPVLHYKAIDAASLSRPRGIVLMLNKGYWEPLARPEPGNKLQYRW